MVQFDLVGGSLISTTRKETLPTHKIERRKKLSQCINICRDTSKKKSVRRATSDTQYAVSRVPRHLSTYECRRRCQYSVEKLNIKLFKQSQCIQYLAAKSISSKSISSKSISNFKSNQVFMTYTYNGIWK